MQLFVQEDSEKTGKVTSAGMYFLHFQVYRMDSTVNAVCNLVCLYLDSTGKSAGMYFSLLVMWCS